MFDLPADYVAGHTHLGYASTVYRAQGATVDVAQCVIDETTSMSGLYVGLTRGKKENRVWAVTDADLDEFEEEAHEHLRGNTPGLTGRDVLERAIARDTRQRSATEIRDEAREYAGSRECLQTLYRYGVNELTGAFVNAHLPAWLDTLSAEDATRPDDQAVTRIRTTCLSLVERGINPADLFGPATANLQGAKDIGALVAWCLENAAEGLGDDTGIAHLPPRTPGTDHELWQWLADTRQPLLDTLETEPEDTVEDESEQVEETREETQSTGPSLPAAVASLFSFVYGDGYEGSARTLDLGPRHSPGTGDTLTAPQWDNEHTEDDTHSL